MGLDSHPLHECLLEGNVTEHFHAFGEEDDLGTVFHFVENVLYCSRSNSRVLISFFDSFLKKFDLAISMVGATRNVPRVWTHIGEPVLGKVDMEGGNFHANSILGEYVFRFAWAI